MSAAHSGWCRFNGGGSFWQDLWARMSFRTSGNEKQQLLFLEKNRILKWSNYWLPVLTIEKSTDLYCLNRHRKSSLPLKKKEAILQPHWKPLLSGCWMKAINTSLHKAVAQRRDSSLLLIPKFQWKNQIDKIGRNTCCLIPVDDSSKRCCYIELRSLNKSSLRRCVFGK